jgi:hypothetical protein
MAFKVPGSPDSLEGNQWFCSAFHAATSCTVLKATGSFARRIASTAPLKVSSAFRATTSGTVLKATDGAARRIASTAPLKVAHIPRSRGWQGPFKPQPRCPDNDGFILVEGRQTKKQRKRIEDALFRPVPADLWGRCFNCFSPNH